MSKHEKTRKNRVKNLGKGKFLITWFFVSGWIKCGQISIASNNFLTEVGHAHYCTQSRLLDHGYIWIPYSELIFSRQMRPWSNLILHTESATNMIKLTPVHRIRIEASRLFRVPTSLLFHWNNYVYYTCNFCTHTRWKLMINSGRLFILNFIGIPCFFEVLDVTYHGFCLSHCFVEVPSSKRNLKCFEIIHKEE